MNSRTKGKEGERELAKVLRSYGHDARRGVQYSGLKGDADVIGVDGIHIECKRVETFRDEVALKQAERDARRGLIPAVFYRRNREEWKVTLRLKMFMVIWNELTTEQKQNIYDKLKLSVKVDKIGKRT